MISNKEQELRKALQKQKSKSFALGQELLKARGNLKKERDLLIASINNSLDKEFELKRFKNGLAKVRKTLADKVLKDSLNSYMKAYTKVIDLEESFNISKGEEEGLCGQIRKVQLGL